MAGNRPPPKKRQSTNSATDNALKALDQALAKKKKKK